MLIVDGFGQWDDLGVVSPEYETWKGLQEFTRSPSGILRLTYLADRFDRMSYGLIRCLYETATTSAFGKWQRFYPKEQSEIITYEHPAQLIEGSKQILFIYQIQKRHRYRRRVGSKYSVPWEVNIQVSIPLESGTSDPPPPASNPPPPQLIGFS